MEHLPANLLVMTVVVLRRAHKILANKTFYANVAFFAVDGFEQLNSERSFLRPGYQVHFELMGPITPWKLLPLGRALLRVATLAKQQICAERGS